MTSTSKVRYSPSDYTIACICPMGLEFAPVAAMLDETHDPIPVVRRQNAYTLGKIGKHCVVVVVLPAIGTIAAATVATQLLNDFHNIQFGLLVGIGAGIPAEVDVRLGDVVVSQAIGTCGGVVQYDLGKREEGGRFVRTGMLNTPPPVLSAHVRKLDSQHRRQGNQLSRLVVEMVQKNQHMRNDYLFPKWADDDLFLSSYAHQSGNTCSLCDRKQIVPRPKRIDNEPVVHYGVIGSANVVVKDAQVRDQLQKDMNILCIEMEAAGPMNNLPCLVIRGICDYADSHKNKRWQPYAAAVAAAYMKELLLIIPAQEVLDIETVNKYFEVSGLLSPVFTGHNEICQHLEYSLSSTRTSTGAVQRRYVLFGLGGSGKTQICLWYAQSYRQRYWGIFWIDASTSSSIQESMVRIAPFIDAESNIESIKRALARAPQPWLLIFDNADDPSLSLSKYLPPGDQGDVIITSRDPACSQYNTVGSHEVGSMSPASSKALLYKIIYGQNSDIETAFDDGERVVELLGHLALAITQAGAYIREISCTFDHYLELYQRRRQEVLEYRPRRRSTDYDHTVYATWSLSLDRIRSMNNNTARFAIPMLKLLSCYHHDQIPLNIFIRAWRNSIHDVSALDRAIWPREISHEFDLENLVQLCTALLASFSLVTKNSDASLSIHPLVRGWSQIISHDGQRKSTCRQAMSLLATSISYGHQDEHYQYRRSLTPHVHACLQLYRSLGDNNLDQDNAWVLYRLAMILNENSFARDATNILEQVVHFYRSQLGEDHPDTLMSVGSLATNYSRLGRQAESLHLTEMLVKLQKSKLGDEHPDTLASIYNLVGDYSDSGRYDEALRLIEQLVDTRRTKLGEQHPDTIKSMHSLANRYGEAGRYQEALHLSEKVVRLRRSRLGEDHPDTIRSMHSLANRYGDMGQQHEALQLTEQVLHLAKINLGEDHPDTLTMMNNLANRYGDAGKLDKALQLAEHVLEVQKRTLGIDHPDTLRSMHGTAISYNEVGRRDEALQMADLTLRLRRAKLGENHRDTLESQYLSNHIVHRIIKN